jgi:cell division septation protein DedD
MANHERRIYEPSDEVRVFDGSEEDEDVEGSRLPLLIVLALLVLAMFGGVVWLAYTQGVVRGRGETPVLTAAAGPERVAPQQPGGTNVPYQGFKIYEQPAPSDDVADTSDAKPAAKPVPKPVAEAPVETPKPVAQAPVEAPKPAPVMAVAAPKPAPVAKAVAPAPVKPVPEPVKTVAAPKPAPAPKSVAALIQQANGTPPPAAARPAPIASAPPAMKQAVIPAPAGGPATGAPRQLGAPAAATPAPKVATAAPAAKPAAGGGYVLQIGAYKSQADADAAWKTYKAKHAALLSGYNSDVQQAELGEKGTWYRLRVGGLGDKEVATALCDRLKADGGACIPGR